MRVTEIMKNYDIFHPGPVTYCMTNTGEATKASTVDTSAGPLQVGEHRLEAAVQGEAVALHWRGRPNHGGAFAD